MRMKLLAATILAAGVATGASAQQAGSFAGPYMGGQIGYDSYNIGINDPASNFVADLGGDGIEGGIFAGYNFQMQNFVLGAEAQLSLSDASSTFDIGSGPYEVKARESYGLSARAGALLSDSALLYVHGGWVKTKFKDDFDSNRLDGWKVGLGLEYLVTENVSARAEYSYIDYETFEDVVEPKNSVFQFGVAWHF